MNFQSAEQVTAYESTQYGASTYSTVLWAAERDMLDRIVHRMDPSNRRSYLDFACGTGRVMRHLRDRFDRAVGVDISEEMLGRARMRVPDGEFVRVDVRFQPDALDERFDLITAFRFLLNADPIDRVSSLVWLRRRLREHTGRVLVNNHGNLWSHKAVTHALRHVRRDHVAPRVIGNVLSDGEARRIFSLAGFEVESVHGCGVLSAKSMRLLPASLVRSIERRAAGSALARIGVNQLYVLRVGRGVSAG